MESIKWPEICRIKVKVVVNECKAQIVVVSIEGI